jgi:arginyl-tRNA synthetase
MTPPTIVFKWTAAKSLDDDTAYYLLYFVPAAGVQSTGGKKSKAIDY